VSLDASRFDQHVSVRALQYEHGFYKWVFDDDPMLSRLLSWQLKNMGHFNTAEGILRYSSEGGRMSGDMNTSCGNVILMCAMMHGFIRSRRWAKKPRLINDGDDCVFIVEACDAVGLRAHVQEYFRTFGFTMTEDGRTDIFEEVDFCQARPVWDGEEWVMCRNPHLCLDKDLMTVRPIFSELQWLEHWGAVASGGLAIASHLPVFGGFYAWMERVSRGHVGVLYGSLKYLAKGVSRRDRPVCEDARVSFYKAWGLTPGHQIELERRYAAMGIPAWKAPWKEERGVFELGIELTGV
jgi:hypothetical protein